MAKTIVTITAATILVITSQIFLKKGLAKTGGIEIDSFRSFSESFFRLFQEKYIYIGAAIAVIGALVWLIVISKKDLTVAFPVSSGIFFIVLFLFSWIFLNESITIWKVLGIGTILIGISIIL